MKNINEALITKCRHKFTRIHLQKKKDINRTSHVIPSMTGNRRCLKFATTRLNLAHSPSHQSRALHFCFTSPPGGEYPRRQRPPANNFTHHRSPRPPAPPLHSLTNLDRTERVASHPAYTHDASVHKDRGRNGPTRCAKSNFPFPSPRAEGWNWAMMDESLTMNRNYSQAHDFHGSVPRGCRWYRYQCQPQC